MKTINIFDVDEVRAVQEFCGLKPTGYWNSATSYAWREIEWTKSGWGAAEIVLPENWAMIDNE